LLVCCEATTKLALAKHLVINSGLTLSHASAVHKLASGAFVDYENLVMDWKLLEFATVEVNRSFLYNTLNIFVVALSSGCKPEVAFGERKFSAYG
jgi:hypothetical protein